MWMKLTNTQKLRYTLYKEAKLTMVFEIEIVSLFEKTGGDSDRGGTPSELLWSWHGCFSSVQQRLIALL